MKVAADFRDTARAVLNGKWKIAVLVGLIATLLGAVEDMGPEVKINIDASSPMQVFNLLDRQSFPLVAVLIPISEHFLLEVLHIL